MSLLNWLTTGSNNGILLQQEKEPALSKPFLPFFSSATLQSKPFELPFSVDTNKLDKEKLCEISRLANIIDERDGKKLCDTLKTTRKVTTICADAVDDEPYVSSQINPLLHCRLEVVQALKWLRSAFHAEKAVIAVYKNMFPLDTKIPASIEDVEVFRIKGRYPTEIRAFNKKLDDTLIIGSAALLHLYRAVTKQTVQTTSFVTIAGNCIANPCNMEITIGTPISQVLDRCGMKLSPSYLIEGSAMHGIQILDPEHTLVRADTRSILAFHVDRQEQLYNCIGCGRCIEACPAGLNPCKLYRCVKTHHSQKAISLGLNNCIGCGSCSYTCPSRLDLSYTIKQGQTRFLKEDK